MGRKAEKKTGVSRRIRLHTIFWLGLKELQSLRADPVLVFLILYTFSYAVYAVAKGVTFEVENAAVAIVDEDHSDLSRKIAGAVLPPHFKEADQISAADVGPLLDRGRYIFVIEIPPRYEKDLLEGKTPEIGMAVDATAMAIAGNGSAYLQSIIASEVSVFLSRSGVSDGGSVNVVTRALFNPNLQSSWFNAVMQVINNVTMLSVILTGAALIREREHGTIEHLLVMPVRPSEVMLAKIWANGMVIVVASLMSLLFIVEWALGVPIAGSIVLFAFGAVLYQFSVTALGILLATFTTSMPQFGLLVIPVLIVMNLLSGSTTPMEGMPYWLQYAMQIAPSTHFVAFSQAILYRGAGLDVVWPTLLWLAGIGILYFSLALGRFRRNILS